MGTEQYWQAMPVSGKTDLDFALHVQSVVGSHAERLHSPLVLETAHHQRVYLCLQDPRAEKCMEYWTLQTPRKYGIRFTRVCLNGRSLSPIRGACWFDEQTGQDQLPFTD